MARVAQAWLGICRLGHAGTGPQDVCVAAWADGADSYTALARAAAEGQGWQFLGLTGPFPAAEWQARSGDAGAEAQSLAGAVHAGRSLAFGALRPAGSAAPRAAGSPAAPADPPRLEIEDIGTVAPLDFQLGARVKKTVPEPLQQAIFGQPAPEPGGPAGRMATYALLDAARVPMLVQLLGGSGLRWQPLFTGETAGEMSSVAPCLVVLKEGNAFARRLFTRSAMPGDLWDREPGMVLRSRAGFDPLWRHLRRFTRIRDEGGKWFYFRFWERAVLEAAAEGEGLDLLAALQDDGAGRDQSWVVLRPDQAAAAVYRFRGGRNRADGGRADGVPRMTGAFVRALDRHVLATRRSREIAAVLARLPPGAGDGWTRADLAGRLEALETGGFRAPDKRQEALELFLQAAALDRADEAGAILTRNGQGAGLRLWHLRQMVESAQDGGAQAGGAQDGMKTGAAG